jgi:hypothetical protein
MPPLQRSTKWFGHPARHGWPSKGTSCRLKRIVGPDSQLGGSHIHASWSQLGEYWDCPP